MFQSVSFWESMWFRQHLKWTTIWTAFRLPTFDRYILFKMNEHEEKNRTLLTYFVLFSFIKSLSTIFVSLWFLFLLQFTYSIDTHQNHSIHISMEVNCQSLTREDWTKHNCHYWTIYNMIVNNFDHFLFISLKFVTKKYELRRMNDAYIDQF